MTFDEEAHGRNLERWKTMPLALFQVEGWPETPTSEGMGELVGIGFDGTSTRIVMSAAVLHRRPDGAEITVTSHRPEDHEGTRDWLSNNMVLRAARRRRRAGHAPLDNDEADGSGAPSRSA